MKEVAAMVGVSVSTTKSRKFHARRRRAELIKAVWSTGDTVQISVHIGARPRGPAAQGVRVAMQLSP